MASTRSQKDAELHIEEVSDALRPRLLLPRELVRPQGHDFFDARVVGPLAKRPGRVTLGLVDAPAMDQAHVE